jgi:hypothetical protein
VVQSLRLTLWQRNRSQRFLLVQRFPRRRSGYIYTLDFQYGDAAGNSLLQFMAAINAVLPAPTFSWRFAMRYLDGYGKSP